MPEPILASSSPYRRSLLERIGLEPRCIPPSCNEAVVQGAGLKPANAALALARQKAESVADRDLSAVVLGADQVCELDGEFLNKPGSIEAAVEQLSAMQGRQHALHTAVCVIAAGRDEGNLCFLEHVDTTRLVMRDLSRDQIVRYVERDQPLDCAGSYKLEAGGIALFDKIQSEDHTAIIGLPMIVTVRFLRECGLDV